MGEREIITRVDQARNSRRALLKQDKVVRAPEEASDPIESSEEVFGDPRIGKYTDEIDLLSKPPTQGNVLEIIEDPDQAE